jgi:hypothetical protein
MEGRLKTFFYELLPDTMDGRKTHTQRLGDGVVGIPQTFWTRIRLEQNAAMEQGARSPFARRHHVPQHTAFLIREGNPKFGHGGAPSLTPQSVVRRRTNLAQPVNRRLPSY